VFSGDAQQADPDDVLPDPVRFKVFDGLDHPMGGVTVTFYVPIGGGRVPSESVVTDSTGIVQTIWTMGPFGGAQTLEARVNGIVRATATATTCDPDECFPEERLSSNLSDARLLLLSTYDSSGQTVHPDVVRGHWQTTGYWMAVTPYPGGDATHENPSIFHSRTSANWDVPPGVTNPLSRPAGSGYFSDPDIVVDTDHSLWLYFRSVINGQNIINVLRSPDGVHWDAGTAVVAVGSHKLVSPAVVRGAPHGPWQMWSVNAGPIGCSAPTTTIERRQSNDGLNWSKPTDVSLEQPGQSIWHIDVQWIPARSEYWAIYNTYPAGTSCNTNALYLARSPDGINWTVYPSPIVRAGLIDAFKHVIYRSTFFTDAKATRITLWLSGAQYSTSAGYVWRTAAVATRFSDLIAIASTPTTAISAPPFRRDLPPPEPDIGH